MKILHVCALGMTVKHLLKPQMDYFLSRGDTVEAVCSPGVEVEALRQQGYTIHTVPIERRILSAQNLKSLHQLSSLMRIEQYDIVHVHTPIASVLGRVAAKLSGIPHIIYTAHGFPFHDRSPWLEYWLYFLIEKGCAAFTDLILTQNLEDVETATRRHLCHPDKVRYLGNGIDSDRFDPAAIAPATKAALRQSLGIPESARAIVGTIGRLTYKKGSRDLVEALARLTPQFPNLHVLIIGGQLDSDPEPFQTQLQARIRDLGLENHITLTGYREDIPELLSLLDIFVLPTFTHEGLPRSIVEAMAMKLPVVATDIRGCREVVVDGKTGLIVPPQNVEALATALGALLADNDRRLAFGNAGQQRQRSQFDEGLVFQRLANFYSRLDAQDVCADGYFNSTEKVTK